MLPPSWKREVQKAVEETANASGERQKAENEKNTAEITAAIEGFVHAYSAQHNKPKRKDKIKRVLNVATVVLLFGTAIFTGLGWWIFRGQLGEMIRAYDFADANAKRQLRPNVLPVDGAVSLHGNTAYTATFNLKNTGQTPAFSVSNWAATKVDFSDVSMSGTVRRFARQEVEREVSSTDLGSGLSYSISRNGTLLPTDLDDLISGKKVFWMWGRIQFDDFFQTSKDRTAESCHFEEFFVRSNLPNKISEPWPLTVIRNDIADCDGMLLDRKP
jgi:hypothetical protein